MGIQTITRELSGQDWAAGEAPIQTDVNGNKVIKLDAMTEVTEKRYVDGELRSTIKRRIVEYTEAELRDIVAEITETLEQN